MFRLPNRHIEQTIDALFDAAVLPELWPAALDRLAGDLGAAGAVVIPKDPGKIALGFPTSVELGDLMHDFVSQDWYLQDIRGERGWPLLATKQSIIVEEDLVSEEERRSMPYFQELFEPYGLPWFGGIGFRVDGAQWCLTLIRGAGQGRYSREDLTPFVALKQYLARIVTLAYKVRAAADAQVVEVAQLLGVNSLILAQDGRVIGASDEALDILAPMVTLRNERLVATASVVDRDLQRVIAGAISSPTSSTQWTQAWTMVPRTGQSPIIVQALTLPRIVRDAFTSAVAVLFLRDPVEEGALDPAILCRLFGLSMAEARVAIQIAEGRSAETIAAIAGVSISTVRNQLRSVFAKCGVNRQAELAALLGRIPKSL